MKFLETFLPTRRLGMWDYFDSRKKKNKKKHEGRELYNEFIMYTLKKYYQVKEGDTVCVKCVGGGVE
jgi:hypothetical protein